MNDMHRVICDGFADLLEDVAKRVRAGEHQAITFGRPPFEEVLDHDVVRIEVDFGPIADVEEKKL